MARILPVAVLLIGWLVLDIAGLTTSSMAQQAQPGAFQGNGSAMAPTVVLTDRERAYLAALGPITVCPDPDWVPYEHVDAQGNFTGIAADLLALLSQRLGIQFTIITAKDWNEALALSRNAEILVLPFLNQTPDREEWLVFTDPLFIDPAVFITHQEHPFITDPAMLKNRTIVFPVGTSMEEHVRRDYPNLEVVHVASEREVFRRIEAGKADMTLRSLAIAAYTIRKEGLFNLKIAGQAPDQYVNRLRMGVLKNQPMLRDILNKGIATITPSEREEIVNRHIHIQVVRPMDYGFILRIAAVLFLLVAVSIFWSVRVRRVNMALKEKTNSLESALTQVKTLSGLLPICANCKNIRNDAGFWMQVETYVSQHTDARFSHGVCPDCIRKLYPDIADQIIDDQ